MEDFFIAADIDGFLLLRHMRCGRTEELGLDISAAALMDAIEAHRCAA